MTIEICWIKVFRLISLPKSKPDFEWAQNKANVVNTSKKHLVLLKYNKILIFDTIIHGKFKEKF